MLDFSTETLKAKRAWNDALKGNNTDLYYCTQQSYPS
jgi:hypothetical protein